MATVIDLRADAGAATALAGVLGVALPTTGPGSAETGDLAVLRLAPDRWLVRAPLSAEASLAARLARAGDGGHAMVTVLSDAFALFRLRGAGVRDLLAQGVAIDLDVGVFVPGSATRCALAKTSVVLHLHAGAETWDLYVESPLQDYLAHWLQSARSPDRGGVRDIASQSGRVCDEPTRDPVHRRPRGTGVLS